MGPFGGMATPCRRAIMWSPGSLLPRPIWVFRPEKDTITLYIEAINPTPEAGLQLEVDPDGPGPQDFVCVERMKNLILKVESIKYRRDPAKAFKDLTDGTLFLKSQTVEFKAVITPDIDPFPTEAVQWTGTFGATGEGETVSHAYDGAVSALDTDYKTVIAGNKTVHVVATDKVLGIHSNADPGGSILQSMHAWISLTDFSSLPAHLTTYGLWHTSVSPDQNRRYSPDVDMYVDIENSWAPGHRRYYLLLPSQYATFVRLVG